MIDPNVLQQTGFSESRQRLIGYLKDKYTNNDSNTFNLEVAKQLLAIFNARENRDYQLLETCAVSGDPKLLLAFMKLLALAYLPPAKDAILSGSVIFHEADGDNTNKDWLEYNASNIDRNALNLIRRTLTAADCSNLKLIETGFPFINCSITALITIEKLTKQFTFLLNKIAPDKIIDELLLSVDPSYQPQEEYAGISNSRSLNK